MEKYCKNCGAYIGDGNPVCPDCGKTTANSKNTYYCPECGEKIDYDEKFCRNCGVHLQKTQEPQKESFLDKYKTPIIIVASILAIVVVAAGASTLLSPYGTQEIPVDSFTFEIPETYEHDILESYDTYENGVRTKCSYWSDPQYDFIEFDVIYTEHADKVNKKLGGQKVNISGKTGYYNELSDAYSFSFVKDDKLCTIYASNNDTLFNEIKIS